MPGARLSGSSCRRAGPLSATLPLTFLPQGLAPSCIRNPHFTGYQFEAQKGAATGPGPSRATGSLEAIRGRAVGGLGTSDSL